MSREADLVLLKLIENDKEVITRRQDDADNKIELLRSRTHDITQTITEHTYIFQELTKTNEKTLGALENMGARVDLIEKKEYDKHLKSEWKADIFRKALDLLKSLKFWIPLLCAIFFVDSPQILSAFGKFIKPLL